MVLDLSSTFKKGTVGNWRKRMKLLGRVPDESVRFSGRISGRENNWRNLLNLQGCRPDKVVRGPGRPPGGHSARHRDVHVGPNIMK